MFAQPLRVGCGSNGFADSKTAGQTDTAAGQPKIDDTAPANSGPTGPVQQPRRGGLAYHSTTRTYRFL